MKNNQFGRTMVEVLMVLGILGVLGASIIRLVNNMFDKYKTTRVSTQIIDLQKNLANRYAAIGNYKGLTVDLIVSERIAPSDMMDISSKTLHHTYLGEVKVAPESVGGIKGTDKAVRITFEDLPQNICIELATMNWRIRDSSDLISITLNGRVYSWVEMGVAVSDALPITVPIATTYCRKTKDNDISWLFY